MKNILAITGSFAFMLHSAASASTESAPTAQTCPNDFYTLPLYPQASLCQRFDQAMPASLIYHAKTDQNSAQVFYQESLGEPEQAKVANGRIVMQYQNGQKIIVISPDGAGTQVDILVKSVDIDQESE